MTQPQIQDLPWLLDPKTKEFENIYVNVRDRERSDYRTFAELSKFRLNTQQLLLIDNQLDKCDWQENEIPNEFHKFKLGVTGNYTTSFIAPAIRSSSLRFGLAVEIVEANFNQVTQLALDPENIFVETECDAILVLLDQSFINFKTEINDRIDENNVIDDAVTYIKTVLEGFKNTTGKTVIINSIPKPITDEVGNLNSVIFNTTSRIIDRVNAEIYSLVRTSSAQLVDFSNLSSTVGTQNWFDHKYWLTARMSFSPDCIPIAADYVCRTISALVGKSKKVLVLDLDNTLWGGVVGDDGTEQIKIGAGDPIGEAHLNLQRVAKNYAKCGIILAVASKNDDSIARQPFISIPDMLLKLEDFAIFQANWQNKPANLEKIATALNLGLDSFVFVDDNPVERALVREKLPTVTVPELPINDPTYYATIIQMAGYFNTTSITREDKERTALYKANASRAIALNSSDSLENFLLSLDSELAWSNFDNLNIQRIAQLINKTNQFNFTTRRRTESEVIRLIEDQHYFTMYARLTDKFGDNGIIAICILHKNSPTEWEIDTFLMSCRVMKRQVEHVIVDIIVKNARKAGAETVLGLYNPTAKNQMIANTYGELGFKMISSADDGTTRWLLKLEEYKTPKLQIKFFSG